MMAIEAKPSAGDRGTLCCPRQCDYALPKVRYHLGRLLAHERAGEPTGRPYSAPVLDRFGGAPGDGDTASIDLRRVVGQLRREQLPVTAEAVAARLCPRALDGYEESR